MDTSLKPNETSTTEPKTTNICPDIVLKLGDVIQIDAPNNDILNGNKYLVDYIDSTQTRLINTNTFTTTTLTISNETIGDGTIECISLLARNTKEGYARQNNLLPETWINIYFGENAFPVVITGKITNLEEDMIEIKTFPNEEVIYINFKYQGIPLNLPIEAFIIREVPEAYKKKYSDEKVQKREDNELELEQDDNDKQEGSPDEQIGTPDENEQKETPYGQIEDEDDGRKIKEQKVQAIYNADQIVFGEDVGNVQEIVSVSARKSRFTIEKQTADLLDEIISDIPVSQRSTQVLNNAHLAVNRFVQLRKMSSKFDIYDNVIDKKDISTTPLVDKLMQFNAQLYWLLLVAKNRKKIYDDSICGNEDENTNIEDYELICQKTDLKELQDIILAARENIRIEGVINYEKNMRDINKFMTPFSAPSDQIGPEVMVSHEVKADITTIVNNLGDLFSSVSHKREIQPRKMVVQKYITGLEYLSTATKHSSFTKLTPDDKVYVNSILTLPIATVLFSKINLPSSSILQKSNLSEHFLNYWQLLKQHTPIKTVPVAIQSSQDEDVQDNTFVNKQITHFNPDLTDTSISDMNDYENYLRHIVPSVSELFDIVKPTIVGQMSIVSLLNHMEPFLIYSNNLTYDPFEKMSDFIDEQISHNNGQLENSKRIIGKIHNSKITPTNYKNVLYNIFDANPSVKDSVFGEYGFYDVSSLLHISTSEFLKRIKIADYGNFYFTSVAYENIALMYPKELDSIFNNLLNENQNDDTTSGKICNDVVIAKKYTSRHALAADNDKTIFFDKQYDDTDYSIMETPDIKESKHVLSPEEFTHFVESKLLENLHDFKFGHAYLAETLINGIKEVINGQYAILVNHENIVGTNDTANATTDGAAGLEYYIRKNDKWVLDKNIDPSAFATPDMLCMLQEKCTFNYATDTCESLSTVKNNAVSEDILHIINQFDKKYEITKDDLIKEINNRILTYYDRFDILMQLDKKQTTLYNNQQYNLGMKAEHDANVDIIVSPHFKLFNLILGQSNFIQKQTNLVKFANLYTRSANPTAANIIDGKMESNHWRYCIDSNAKLIPTFLFELAKAFVQKGPNAYINTINEFIKTIGAKSDDGAYWVDKESGYIISRINLVADTFDSIQNLAEDTNIYTAPISDEAEIVADTKQVSDIKTIIATLELNMGINIETERQFVINTVVELMENSEVLKPRAVYAKQEKQALEKGKKIPSYEYVYNSVMLYLTLGMVLIAIQVAIPPVVTNKTFPGCIRGFGGFPFEESDDNSGLEYIACIVHKIKVPEGVWKITSKKGVTQEKLVGIIKTFISSYILKFASTEINRKISDKVNYLMTQPAPSVSPTSNHNLGKWTSFLPLNKKISMKPVQNIDSGFNSRLLEAMRIGDKKQNDYINVLKSKIIYYSYSIQQSIQKIIDNKELLFKSALVPYTNNSCCYDGGNETVLQYFIKDDHTIESNNKIINTLSTLVNDIQIMTKSSIFLGDVDTKRKYPKIPNIFSESTIYRTFIKMCNMRSYIPIPENLLAICTTKPDYIDKTDSINEIIEKLKKHGVEYSHETFLRLLQLVESNNIVNISFIKSNFTCLDSFIRTLGKIEEGSPIFEVSHKLNLIMENFEIITTEETSAITTLKNYLIRNTKKIRNKLIKFLKTNTPPYIRTQKLNKLLDFITNIRKWVGVVDSTTVFRDTEEETTDNASFNNSINYYKNSVKFLSNVLPSMVINDKYEQKLEHKKSLDGNYWRAHKHWNLSETHISDLTSIFNKFYEPLNTSYLLPLQYKTDKDILNSVLFKIQRACKDINMLSNTTPIFTNIELETGEFVSSSIDSEMVSLLFEYYILQALVQYIDVSATQYSEKDIPIVGEENVEKEEIEEQDISLVEENVIKLNRNICAVMFAGISMLMSTKNITNISYNDVMRDVFLSREHEKYTFTDRLAKMTDEERKVDMMLKANKLGVWSKGLAKGLKSYTPENYDEERQMAHNIAALQNQYNLQDRDIGGIAFQEAVAEMDVVEDMGNSYRDFAEDYLDGDPNGDEILDE